MFEKFTRPKKEIDGSESSSNGSSNSERRRSYSTKYYSGQNIGQNNQHKSHKNGQIYGQINGQHNVQNNGHMNDQMNGQNGRGNSSVNPKEQRQRFANKVVIITGSSSGIGRAAAIGFGKEGAKLVIHGQNAQRLKETAKMLEEEDIGNERILMLIGPMEEEEMAERIVKETVAKFGRIDVLINNAAAVCKPKHWGSPDKCQSMANLDYLYRVNFRSAIHLTQLALPHLERTGGNVVMVSSILGIRPSPDAPYYAALKAALDHYMRSVAQTFGSKGVRINCLNPGVVQTNFLSRNDIKVANADSWLDEITVLKRAGQPEEMAELLKMLASDDGGYICGTTLVADGGLGVKMPTVPF